MLRTYQRRALNKLILFKGMPYNTFGMSKTYQNSFNKLVELGHAEKIDKYTFKYVSEPIEGGTITFF